MPGTHRPPSPRQSPTRLCASQPATAPKVPGLVRMSAVCGLAQQRVVLLVLVGAWVERQDRVLLMEWILAKDRDPLRARLDHVVTGLGLPTHASGRNRARVAHEQ